MSGDVTFWGLAASLVLVGVAIALSAWRRLGLERDLVLASARAMAQLLVVGLALAFVLDEDTPLALSWLWVVGMTVFAADVARRRAREVPRFMVIALAAFLATSAVTLAVVFGLGIFPLESRTLVPIAGLVIGNSMNATVLSARRGVEELRDKRLEVEARLALGQPSWAAALPYLRSAARTALVPQIETTKAVGIVFLPGAMTGLILAGVDPLDAVLVQVVVMYLVLASAATTTTVVSMGLVRRLFTPDHRLRPLARPADG
ncbi:MAG: UDP-glucose/iron transport system permease protein [Miltoncostaeaceae bacterium]|jgi:putative ABC transport system permease protein|nr:UDP-glucose/iron transport system permease protein [Miltoncostaeaceae bacterium]